MSYYSKKTEMLAKINDILKEAARNYNQIDKEKLLLDIDMEYGMKLTAKKHLQSLIEVKQVIEDEKGIAWNFEVKNELHKKTDNSELDRGSTK